MNYGTEARSDFLKAEALRMAAALWKKQALIKDQFNPARQSRLAELVSKCIQGDRARVRVRVRLHLSDGECHQRLNLDSPATIIAPFALSVLLAYPGLPWSPSCPDGPQAPWPRNAAQRPPDAVLAQVCWSTRGRRPSGSERAWSLLRCGHHNDTSRGTGH